MRCDDSRIYDIRDNSLICMAIRKTIKGEIKVIKKIINLTPHKITCFDQKGNITREFESEGNARVEQHTIHRGIECGVQISETGFGEVQGLPEESIESGICYIVSMIVRTASPNRLDLLVPNDLVRDEEGRILGCKSLSIR